MMNEHAQRTNELYRTYYPLVLVLTEMVAYLSNDMYLPALANIAREFQASQAAVQLSLTTWFLGLATMHLVLGPVSDRFGRRVVVLSGSALFVLTCLGCALTTSIVTLIIIRYFQGVGVCAVVVAGYASIHELHHRERAIHILAWMSAVTVLAPAFGPLAGGLMLTLTTWHAIFWFLAVANGLLWLFLWHLMPESNAAIGDKTIQVKQLFGQYVRIVTNLGFITNALAFSLIFCGSVSWVVAGPFMVMQAFGYSAVMFGFVQGVVFGCFIIASRSVSQVAERIGYMALVKLGFGIMLFAAFLALALTYSFPNWLLALVGPLMVYMLGQGLLFATLNRSAVESSNEPMGAISAVFFTLMSIAGAFGSILVSVFYDGQMVSVALIMTCLVFLASVIKR